MNARQYGLPELETWYKPAILKAADALVRGGIHTPESSLGFVLSPGWNPHAVPDPRYLRRIEQWLAEGIDIDADGQFTERSTGGYNGINNRALVIIADNLQKWELLEPIRKNLNAMAYLMHPDGEVVTEISRRQDLNTRGYMVRLFPAHRVSGCAGPEPAVCHHGPPCWSRRPAACRTICVGQKRTRIGPKSSGIPDDYEKVLRPLGPCGFVAVCAVPPCCKTEIASSFTGMASRGAGGALCLCLLWESPVFWENLRKEGNTYTMQQQLQAPYYQPLDPVEKVGTEEWDTTRVRRKQTEISHLTYQVDATETPKGCKCAFAPPAQIRFPSRSR